MTAECCDVETPMAPDCATSLQQAVNVYHQLMVGAAPVVSVTTDGGAVQYDRRNLPALKSYIEGLHQRCPCETSAAILGIPARRRVGQPVYGPRTAFGGLGGCCK